MVALQPVAIVDHVVYGLSGEEVQRLTDGDEPGGSKPCDFATLTALFSEIDHEIHTRPGGSAANTLRGMAAGFGSQCRIVGARGRDEWGAYFTSSLRRCSINTERLRAVKGPTGRCVILSTPAVRTMRTCMADAVRIAADDLVLEDFQGAQLAFLSAYSLYGPGLLERAAALAAQAGCLIALDLGSFEIVRQHRETIMRVLSSGAVHVVLCNEDEAAALTEGDGVPGGVTDALHALTAHCRYAVVTQGEAGCSAAERGRDGILTEPAVQGLKAVDTTGAGDLFGAGFLYGLVSGCGLARCMQIGCLAGGAAVQAVGAELSPSCWEWMHARLHGPLAAQVVRESPGATHRELLRCYQLIERLGRGVVYYGSARLKPGSRHYEAVAALAGAVSGLLDSTTWTGGGPGLMQAASEGARAAGNAVGGIRIAREAASSGVLSASYLPESDHVVCKYMSARKVALVDAGVRMQEADRTAYVYVPGGLGTCDELFELLTLMQLGKLDSKLPVPLILCNFGGFYDGLVNLLASFECSGTLKASELGGMWIAESNDDVLACLSSFYGSGGASECSLKLASEVIAAATERMRTGSSVQ